MSEVKNPSIQSGGVVTFLDVLGWKGIYDRKQDAISSLTNLVDGLRSQADRQRGRVVGDVSIKSISDTIVFFTPCSEMEINTAIEIHGSLCQWAIPESIAAEIPVRGAISYGEYETKDNIFVGKAVDEAAAWHEQSDWIGVHLTPSAQFSFVPDGESDLWKEYSPPNKSRLTWTPFCVNWTALWRNRQEEIDRIKAKFCRLGPIVPEISGKFVNTLKFIEAMKPQDPK